MDIGRNKNKFWIRIIAAACSFTLLYSNLYASGLAEFLTYNNLTHHKIPNICIPEQYGRIERANGQTVILIKDAHCVYEAQKNIERIVEILIRDYKIDLVCVEGASGLVNTSVFQSMPDKKAREKGSDKFVKEGLLTASEALSISRANELPFTIWGVEDKRLYVEDFKLFRETISKLSNTERFLSLAKGVTGVLKERMYNPELKVFSNKLIQYKNNKISLKDWLEYIKCQNLKAPGHQTKNIRLTIKTIEMEDKVNFRQAEQERVNLLKELEKVLPKEDLKKLIEKCLLFKLGKISSLSYYAYIEQYTNKCTYPLTLPSPHRGEDKGEGDFKKGIPILCNCRNLKRYIRLVKLHSRINEDALFRELDEIEDVIADGLFKNHLEGFLFLTDKKINILDRLFHLQISRDEFEYYSNHKALFSIDEMTKFLIIQAGLNGIEVPEELKQESFVNEVKEYVVPAEEFYRLARKRDEVLVENLLKKMEVDNKQTAVIVAGGFHARGIRENLEKRGIECIEITPKITDIREDNPYLGLMMDEDLNIEGLLPENLGLPLIFGLGAKNIDKYKGVWKDLAGTIIANSGLKISQLKKRCVRVQKKKEIKKSLWIYLN